MTLHARDTIMTVVIGGAAGEGIREAGMSFGKLLAACGYDVVVTQDYPSLIRGGHNFTRITFSKEKVTSDYKGIDVLVAINQETLAVHVKELNENAVAIADRFSEADATSLGVNAIALPLSAYVKELNAPMVTKSSVALGALCYYLDLPLDKMVAVLNIAFKPTFKDKALAENIALAEKGYTFMADKKFRHWRTFDPGEAAPGEELVEGNPAFAKGLITAGLDFYVAYPMTPSSSILHYLAANQKAHSYKVVQPENEIAVINMALGMAYAGHRVAVGTSGGGFALMQEAFSFAGIAELPVAIAMSQRMGPATGVPTYNAQAELLWTVHSGHGEFPRIVLAPGDPEEAFVAGRDSLNLAWKWQLPVVVLLDKHLSESASTSVLQQTTATQQPETGEIYGGAADASYHRYAITENGVSPMAFPGTAGSTVKINSYEHDEEGLATEVSSEILAMQEKRFKKLEGIAKDMEQHETVKVYGEAESRTVVVFWGSTKGAVLEAAKYMKKPVKLLQVLWMEPFDTARFAPLVEGAEHIVVVEANRTGQLAALIRERTGIAATRLIARNDGRPFEPLELAGELDRATA